MRWFLLIVAAWVGCGVLAYRVMVWDWLRWFDLKREDRNFFILLSMLGPFTLVGTVPDVVRYLSYKHGRDPEEVLIRRRGRYR